MQVRAAGHAMVVVVSGDGATGAASGKLQRQSDVGGRPWKTTAAECGDCGECDGYGVGWCGREIERLGLGFVLGKR